MIGKMQAFAALNIATTATAIGWIEKCQGADYILLSFRAGSNTSNALAAIAGTGMRVADSSTPAGTGLQLTAVGLPKTDGTVALNSNFAALVFVDAGTNRLPIPFPAILLSATMLTAVSNGVIVEAWPVFKEQYGSAKLDLSAAV